MIGLRRRCRGIRHLLEAHTVQVKQALASRAVFQDADYSEVEVKVQIEDGTILVLRMSPRVAGPLIMQMSTVYNAINPPLRSGLGQATWNGMDT